MSHISIRFTALALLALSAPAASQVALTDVSGRWTLNADPTFPHLSPVIQLIQTPVTAEVGRLEGIWGGRRVSGYISAGRFTLTTEPYPDSISTNPWFTSIFAGQYFVIRGTAVRIGMRFRSMRGEIHDARLSSTHDFWGPTSFSAR